MERAEPDFQKLVSEHNYSDPSCEAYTDPTDVSVNKYSVQYSVSLSDVTNGTIFWLAEKWPEAQVNMTSWWRHIVKTMVM